MQYSKAALEIAMQEIESGRMTISEASRSFNIPKSTLSEKRNKIYSHETPGMPGKLLKTEEDGLQDWILKRAKRGMPVNTEAVRKKASEILTARTGNAPLKIQ